MGLELWRYCPHVAWWMHHSKVCFAFSFLCWLVLTPHSAFLGEITKAYQKNPHLSNLLLDPFFTDALHRCVPSFRRVVSQAVLLGVPVPCFSSALAFYDGFRSARVPANLLQAQRDYFGAHTYELEGQPGTWIHTNWTGRGGRVSSSTYDA
jgi:6-phosphogluconate dehydrogenase